MIVTSTQTSKSEERKVSWKRRVRLAAHCSPTFKPIAICLKTSSELQMIKLIRPQKQNFWGIGRREATVTDDRFFARKTNERPLPVHNKMPVVGAKRDGSKICCPASFVTPLSLCQTSQWRARPLPRRNQAGQLDVKHTVRWKRNPKEHLTNQTWGSHQISTAL